MSASKYPNSGTLSKNDNKKEAQHPDYRGRAEVNGVEWELSAWIKEGPRGKFMSLSFRPPRDRQPNLPGAEQPKKDDDVPF